jgi:hypothetical protein
VWTGFKGPVASSCGRGGVLSGSMNDGEFLYLLSDYQLIKTKSLQWIL